MKTRNRRIGASSRGVLTSIDFASRCYPVDLHPTRYERGWREICGSQQRRLAPLCRRLSVFHIPLLHKRFVVWTSVGTLQSSDGFRTGRCLRCHPYGREAWIVFCTRRWELVPTSRATGYPLGSTPPVTYIYMLPLGWLILVSATLALCGL